MFQLLLRSVLFKKFSRRLRRFSFKHFRCHVLVAGVLAGAIFCGLSSAFHNALLDLRYAWTSRAASGDIVLVAIDSASIEKIGVWPWSRGVHAALIDILQTARVQEIIFDVDFSAPSDAVSDSTLEAALKRSEVSVVLPTFHQAARARDSIAAPNHVNQPLRAFEAHSWPALVNVWVESDGRVRRYPYGGALRKMFLPSMGAVIAGAVRIDGGPFLIDFGIESASIPVFSFSDVLRGDTEILRKLIGKKIVVGGTALELGDRFSVPNGLVIPGPTLQILAAESIKQGRALNENSGRSASIALVVLMLTMMLVWRKVTALRRMILLATFSILFEIVAFASQAFLPIVLNTSLFHIAVISYIGAIALEEIALRGLIARIAEKRFQHIAMSLGDALICVDPDKKITVWNPGAEVIFGYSADEAVGRPFDLICADEAFSIESLDPTELQLPGGHIVEFAGRSKSGSVLQLEGCFSGWHGADGFHCGASLRDISVRKREAERIRYLAEQDTVTGLANRNTLQKCLSFRLMRVIGRPFSLLIISVNKFNQINVLLGHSFGDRLLNAVGGRLNTTVADAGLLARIRGEEFAVLVEAGGVGAAALCERLIAAFETPVIVEDRTHNIAIRIGVAEHSSSVDNDDVMGNAYLALDRAKISGADEFVFYNRTFRDLLEQRIGTEAELVLAMENHEFELFYQPQVSLQDRALIGAEALIRWRHPLRGLVPPSEFMSIAHTSSVSLRVANWVLHSACQQARAWEKAGRPIRVGVNLSPSQFQSADLSQDVKEVLRSTGLTPSLLELEVTEDILLDDVERALGIFRELRKIGVRLVFDDFGTGYGGLSYLKRFPLNGLKIDRSFVHDLRNNREDLAIVNSTVLLAKELQLSVVAEGIEDEATAELLAYMGCNEAQGYHFGRPCPASEFERTFLSGGIPQTNLYKFDLAGGAAR